VRLTPSTHPPPAGELQEDSQLLQLSTLTRLTSFRCDFWHIESEAVRLLELPNLQEAFVSGVTLEDHAQARALLPPAPLHPAPAPCTLHPAPCIPPPAPCGARRPLPACPDHGQGRDMPRRRCRCPGTLQQGLPPAPIPLLTPLTPPLVCRPRAAASPA
jgi:hypothetical protein